MIDPEVRKACIGVEQGDRSSPPPTVIPLQKMPGCLLSVYNSSIQLLHSTWVVDRDRDGTYTLLFQEEHEVLGTSELWPVVHDNLIRTTVSGEEIMQPMYDGRGPNICG